jgi:hypothetical protein
MEQNRYDLNRTELYAWLFTFAYFVGLLVVSFKLPVYE